VNCFIGAGLRVCFALRGTRVYKGPKSRCLGCLITPYYAATLVLFQRLDFTLHHIFFYHSPGF